MNINGSLVFDASSASEIANLRVEKLSALPSWVAADVGRLVYITTSQQMYYGDADSWMPLASGGSAFSQAEGDATQASIGPSVNSDGTFNAAAFVAPISGATSVTNAINQLAAYADANNTLAELDDVSLGSLASGDFLRYNGSAWADHTLVLADVTNVTASATEVNQLAGAGAVTADFVKLHAVTASADELNVLDGIPVTLTAVELGYVDGVTSPIQAQLNGLQAGDPGLTSLAALTGPGWVTVSADGNTFSSRQLVEPAAGLTISNTDGGGDATFALANDLAALEGLTTNGLVVRTGDGTAATVSISGSAGRISVANPAGAGGSSPTIDLVTVTDGGTGTFLKITVDAYGRVSGTEAVLAADIETLVDGTYVNIIGDTMTGNLVMGANYVTMTNAPTNDTHAANKAYVDAVANGLTWKNAVKAASVGNLTLSGEQTVDGVPLIAGDRVLVKDQSAPAENGIYVVAAGAWTRSTNADTPAELNGAAVFVNGGTANDNSGWTQTAEVVTVGTSPVVWAQFSGSSTYTWGDGLSASGNTVSVNMGAGITMLPSDEVGVDVVSDLALQLTNANTGGQLTFVLAGGSGLSQSASGLTIAANGVTNAMILNDTITLDADNVGTGTVDLGGTISVFGNTTQGITTSLTGSTFTILGIDASDSQKGVASFHATQFTVTAGNVELGVIENSNLADSEITFTGTTGSDAVALGESMAIIGGAGGEVSTVMGTNSLAISVRDATATLKGVASFDTAHFSVTSGAVSLAATLDDLTNVSGADAASTGDLLTKSAGDWVPVTRAALAADIDLADLGDVVTTTPANNDALIFDGTNWVNQKIYHLETIGTAATTWTVTHGLGQQYCNVTVVVGDEVVIPQSITFTSTTVVTITFNTAVAGKAVVMGIA